MSKSDSLFLLVLASLPVQLGKHFFFPYSYVLGLPIDYRSLIIYVSDLAIILYLTTFFYENHKRLTAIYAKLKSFVIISAILNAYLLIDSILFSLDKEASLVFVAKVIIFNLFALASAVTLSKKEIAQKSVTLLKNLLEIESIILILEFLLQRSLGLTILGERSFDTTTTSIAHASLFGNQLLRPYGTFPHPNVAAAFLVFCLILFLGSKREKIKLVFPSALGFVAAVATFSKAALAALAVTLAILSTRAKGFLLITFAFISFVLLFLKNTSDSSLPTISERMVLIQKSLDISLKNPTFGAGSNNFILELSKANLFSVTQVRLLQPVHNIFFLILSENGAIGLLLFTALLFIVLKSVDTKTKLALFVMVLIFGSVDHFLWTLQQGQLLLWLSLGYILSSPPVIERSGTTKRSNPHFRQ